MSRALDGLKNKLTPKQYDVLIRWLEERPACIVLSGGMRSGKTFLLALMFLIEARRHRGANMIIMGATISSVKRNVISLLEMWLGRPLNLGKSNQFELFGNTVYVFGGDASDSYKAVRGFTSSLSLINEMTTLHQSAVNEVFNRTSVEGALVMCDTNPAHPTHYVKTEYIDKSGERNENGRLLLLAEHFTMLHNITLGRDYLDRQLLLFPEGTTEYERNILGHWIVREEGVIYNMFDEKRHLVDYIPADEPIDRYIGALDWGYKHTGVALVVAKTRTGKYYIVEEVAKTEQTFSFWEEEVAKLTAKYNIQVWYADSARPEYVSQMNRVANVVNARKNVNEGIDTVNQLLAEDKLFFIKSAFIKGLDEIYKYVWKTDSTGKESPKKENDDVMDALRYAIYNEHKNTETRTMYGNFSGPIKYSNLKYDPIRRVRR